MCSTYKYITMFTERAMYDLHLELIVLLTKDPNRYRIIYCTEDHISWVKLKLNIKPKTYSLGITNTDSQPRCCSALRSLEILTLKGAKQC